MQSIGEYKECGVASSCKERDYKSPTDLVVETGAVCIGNGKTNQSMMNETIGALTAMHDQQAILSLSSTNSNMTFHENLASPMLSRGGNGGGNSPLIAKNGAVVRRLTPLECERLQGFPDGWSDIGEWFDSNGRKHHSSDSVRFRALGNSIATPFWFWLLRRISVQYAWKPTLGSLFDGIGGFPYCWERINGKGSAVWASEIEEFPIAVTKYHFPDESEVQENES